MAVPASHHRRHPATNEGVRRRGNDCPNGDLVSTAIVLAVVVVVAAVLVARIGRVNRSALGGLERPPARSSRATRGSRPLPPVAGRRPGLDDQPPDVTSGVYVLEVRRRRVDRGDVDYLEVGRADDVAERIALHRTMEGNNLGVYGIAWTTGHDELATQVNRDLRRWRIAAPGVTAVELYEPAREVYERLNRLWERDVTWY